MRYESHRLEYRYSDKEDPVLIGGFLGAALLFVHLFNTEEGEQRGISFRTEQEQDRLIERYEDEVIADDWGHLEAEIDQLNDTYIQLAPDELELSDLFTNKRQFFIAMSMTIRYMQLLAVGEYHEHIWEATSWRIPFADWLYYAGYKEIKRQRYLYVDWTDMALVNDLAERLKKGDDNGEYKEDADYDDENGPIFTFIGDDAEEILRHYWEWEWENIRRQAAEAPDTEQELTRLKELYLRDETDDHIMEDQVRKLPVDTQKLFRKWMTRWKAFITEKLAPTALDSFPEQQRQTRVEQKLFPDPTLTCPQPSKYTQVRDYINKRSKYDEEFRDYYESHALYNFCEQLTLMFGWYVNPNSLGKSLKREKK